MEDALAAALDRLWQANRATLLARGEVVLAALEAVAADLPADRAAAARDAHVLAGALGTYGRPGSELFAEAERVLADGAATATPTLAERVRGALRALP